MSNRLNLSQGQIKSIHLMRSEILTLKDLINQKIASLHGLKAEFQQMTMSLYNTLVDCYYICPLVSFVC